MKTIIALGCIAALAGCSTTPHYDKRFGDAVRHARTAMTAHPGPPAPDPVAGMDGQAAQLATGRYHDSFKAPPPVVNVINIGGETGSR